MKNQVKTTIAFSLARLTTQYFSWDSLFALPRAMLIEPVDKNMSHELIAIKRLSKYHCREKISNNFWEITATQHHWIGIWFLVWIVD